jgi:hypothetical protein
LRKTFVGEHVLGHKQIVPADGMRAERSVAGYCAKLQSGIRFKPRAVPIHKGKQAYGGLAEIGGARGNLVEGGLGGGVQYLVLPQQFQARALVDGDRGLHHFDLTSLRL